MQAGMLIPPGLPAGQVLANLAGFDHADLVGLRRLSDHLWSGGAMFACQHIGVPAFAADF
jgi:hypothetical protein